VLVGLLLLVVVFIFLYFLRLGFLDCVGGMAVSDSANSGEECGSR